MYFIHNVLTNINTSPTRRIKTHHITVSVVTPYRPNNFKSHGFNNHLFFTYIYTIYIILTKIIYLIAME